jgi:hypothetical protein
MEYRTGGRLSNEGEDASDSGYNSTCDLEVVKRGMEIRIPLSYALGCPFERPNLSVLCG